MLDKPASALRLRERLLESERLMEETAGPAGLSMHASWPLKQ